MSDMQQLMKSQSVRRDVFKHKAYIQRFLIIKDAFSTTWFSVLHYAQERLALSDWPIQSADRSSPCLISLSAKPANKSSLAHWR